MTSCRDPRDTAPTDPLDRLADLALPDPDPALMQADIARARERFVAAGLSAAASEPSLIARWLSPLRLGMAGSAATASVMAAFLLLPQGQLPLAQMPDGSDRKTVAAEGAAPEDEHAVAQSDMAPDAVPAPAPATAASRSAAAAPRDVTIPVAPLPEPDYPPLAAAPPASGGNGSARPAYEAAAEAIASAAPAAPSRTLPRLGAKPRHAPGDAALVDLALPEEEAEFSGSLSFSLSGDQDGLFLDREEGRLAIPVWETAPGMTIQMTDVYLLPARRGFPQILMMKGQLGDQEPWQIFRVSADAVTFDKVITDLVKPARSPGQVEAILNRLPPPD
ncbi:hypothetical protein [Paracoccus sp. IB05]|uniref:hypothetical protein n=1 Tax=Paracoccus sp. IB05 TaxID=2779367 RepID=UPI0018E8748D|nr:hypothetical protein [Paracoccus sp. IB05]MBJ2149548.1 hypothetical protein [Paracoccus sp. IB05]